MSDIFKLKSRKTMKRLFLVLGLVTVLLASCCNNNQGTKKCDGKHEQKCEQKCDSHNHDKTACNHEGEVKDCQGHKHEACEKKCEGQKPEACQHNHKGCVKAEAKAECQGHNHEGTCNHEAQKPACEHKGCNHQHNNEK